VTPDVTIILTSFEQELLLEQAVRMLLTSEFVPHMELLVVDDASGKGLTMIKGLCHRAREGGFGQVRLIRMDSNYGPSIARNVGIEEAAGRYLHFHDGDDLWMPEGWAEGVERMDRDRLTLSVTGLRTISGVMYPKKIGPPVPEHVHPMFHFPLDSLPYATTFLVRRDVKTRYRAALTFPTKFWAVPTSGEDNFFKVEVAAEGDYARFGEYRVFRGNHWGTKYNPPQWHMPTYAEIAVAAFFVLRADLVDAGLVVKSYNWLEDQGFDPSEVAAELDRPAEDFLEGPPSYHEMDFGPVCS